MCIAVAARILALEGGDALIEVNGRKRRASLLRLPEVAVGDWALVAAGTVLRRLEPDEAAEIAQLLDRASPGSARPPTDGGLRWNPE
jgi:hydrogenase expression/formation protein HypC